MTTNTPSISSQLLTVAILTLQHQLQHNRVLRSNTPEDGQTVDYIVVGGGTAGCIVAGRLAEDTEASVLLLEAGGPISVLREMTGNINLTDGTWLYNSVPQRDAAFAFVNQQEFMPYGFGLGGSHLRGLNVYSRGNHRDFDSWSTDYGVQGWSTEEVLPYFIKSENNTDLELVRQNPVMHGTQGPVEISTVENPDPFLLKWRSIVHQAGWPLADFSDLYHQYGVEIPQITQSRSTWARTTTASGYIERALFQKGRTNLHVQLNALVTRILFEGRSAVGVEYLYLKNNQTFQAFAKKEVIISAGPFQSPQLLILSGIGPQDHLESLGIPVLADLPVGSKLHSHFCIPLDFHLNHPEDIGWQLDLDEPNATSVSNLYDFYVHASGPLRQRPVTMMYLASDISGDIDWPDGYLICSTAAGGFSLESILGRYKPEMRPQWREYWRQWVGNPLHLWLTFLNYRPLSRGSVRLRSKNPRDFPLIDPNFFGNRQDLAAIVRVMSIAFEKLFESREGRDLFTYSALPVPGCRFCEDGRPLSRCLSYLACVAQTVTMSDIHDVASAPMGGGNSSSWDHVLDDRLRVRTLQRLRVVDAASLPAIPNANTMAAVMMVGEKGADLIKSDSNLFRKGERNK